MTCDHDGFEAFVGVHRLAIPEGDPITGYAADIKIRCKKCKLPFRFIGLIPGASSREPRTSFRGEELRAPIEPAPDAPRWEDTLDVGHA